jgi:outer membrane protein W
MNTVHVGRGWVMGAVAAALVAAAPAARAQAAGQGFLFQRPGGSLRMWVGYDRPIADSPIFQFVTDTFTLSKNSFGAFDVGGDLAFSIARQADLVFSLGYAGSKAGSEYRHWVDNNNQPIVQTTTLERVPLTLSLKWYLAPPGDAVGRFAWVPRGVTPFVGAGGGTMWYRFQQYGDFIDFTDSAVVNDAFDSHAWTWTAQAFAGADFAVGSRWIFTAQARYTWAQSHLGRDFVGPNQIDLSGFSVTAGLGVRF